MRLPCRQRDPLLERCDATPAARYKIFCFAEDDWKVQAESAVSRSLNFVAPAGPNKAVGVFELRFRVAVRVRLGRGTHVRADHTMGATSNHGGDLIMRREERA